MKGNLRIVLSLIALFSLISCGAAKQSSSNSSEDTSSSIIPISITEIPSSDSSIEPISSSSEEPSSSSVISSSSDDPSSSSEEPSSSIPEETYYHVTFLNYDETLLYEVDVLEGTEAIYQGETPIKPEDDEFTYEFNGWDKDLTNIQSEMTAVAQYSYTAKENWGSIIWF